ncbi:MAG: YraN family protein [Prevotellaceae bacterium]|jgi:putative endonuclease|nr:YraN family protein [Prevotellaceae bacterium]
MYLCAQIILQEEMDERWIKGKKGEELARTFLEQNGFVILSVHWQHGHKELDIVAERGEMLHIVEVRSRSEPCLIEPSQTVMYQKQQNIISAARAYIYKHKITKEVQFDIVSVLFEQIGIKIEYIPKAFYPYYR